MSAAVALAACASDDPGQSTEQASPGAATYRSSCATCHGATGGGGRAPAIGDGIAAETYDRAAMIELVTEGRGAMPGFGGSLSDEQIAEVVDHVRDELGRAQPTTTTSEVARSTGERELSGRPPEIGEDTWALPNGDYRSTRNAPDAAITSETVDDLELAWAYEVPGGATFGNLTTNPIVTEDRVYVGALTTEVHAVDRATGDEVFVVGEPAEVFGPTGVAVGWGQVYGTAGDDDGRGSVLVAYDAEDGEEVWRTDLGGNGGILNVQPVAYDGLVFASTSGYGAGTRATIYAVDAATGAIVWDLPVIEDPDLWGNPDLNSGGGVWYPATIDADRGIAYFGTGNPYPFPGAPGFPNGSSRPGPNRWTNSALAVDIDTGELVWGHQAIEHDIFDRDAMLTARTDVEIEGEARAITLSTGKLGVVFGLDAATGERLWRTEVGTHQNDDLTEIDGPTLVYPGSLGGVQTPLAVADGVAYLCVMNAPTQYAGPEETSYGFTVQLGTADSQLVALDVATGEVLWDIDLEGDAFGGATVSGDLVFTSTFSGVVTAHDRATGDEVWGYEADGGINGWPAVVGDELYVPVGVADPPKLLKFELGG